jgi:hypothetical protein
MKKSKCRLLPIFVDFIEHKRQRYDTAGDYFKYGRNMYFNITRMRPEYSLMVLAHEIIEWILISHKGIKISDIDKFDKASTWDDPGCDPKAPYHKQHMVSIRIEKIICKELGLDWRTYDNSFSKLRWRDE